MIHRRHLSFPLPVIIIFSTMEQYLYEKILREFYYEHVDYLIVGGIALNLHGVPRATFDLDIIVAWDEENIRKIEKILEKLKFKSMVPVTLTELKSKERRKELIRKKHMFALNFYNVEDPLEEIDILIKDVSDFKKLFERKKTIKIDDFEIYLISLDDLIKLKRSSRRHKDKEDMKNLMLVKHIREKESHEH